MYTITMWIETADGNLINTSLVGAFVIQTEPAKEAVEAAAEAIQELLKES